MKDHEVWLILFQALLSTTPSPEHAADLADKALREYEIRCGDEAQDES